MWRTHSWAPRLHSCERQPRNEGTKEPSPIDTPQDSLLSSFGQPKGVSLMPEILQGTLDLMILKALDVLGPLHGFGIARRLEQISGDILQMNEGTVYASLLRLQQRGWIKASWGVSDNNRKAKFYAITASGRKQLSKEAENWEQIAGVMGRVLNLAKGR